MGAFFASDGHDNNSDFNKWAIRKEGYLYKQSRHLNTWRRRWVVLHHTYLATFTQKHKYVNPTEEIDFEKYTKLSQPKFDEVTQSFIIQLYCKDDKHSFFNFRLSNEESIQDWHTQIRKSIRASNDNLLCTLLEPQLITGPIASYLMGYERFNRLNLVNKFFSSHFDIKTFDFKDVYLSDSMYWMSHFERFHNDKKDNNHIAIKQGLYRIFNNPNNDYTDHYIDSNQRKQLLYILIVYGPLMRGSRKFSEIERKKYQKLLKMNAKNENDSKQNNAETVAQYGLHLDPIFEEETKETEFNIDDDGSNNNTGKQHNALKSNSFIELELKTNKDTNTNIEFEYEYKDREYLKMQCVDYSLKKAMKYVEIPQNVHILDFSRHVNAKSILSVLTFTEDRKEEVVDDSDNGGSADYYNVVDNGNYGDPGSDDGSDGDDDDGDDGKYQDSDEKGRNKHKVRKIPSDVKWLCNLLLYSHDLTFEQFQILDLSHNAFEEKDIIALSDSILRRDNALNIRQLLLDGIRLSNSLTKSNKAVTKLFNAIKEKCPKLEYLSLRSCLLTDESCEVIKMFYRDCMDTRLVTLDLLMNSITERGVDVLNEIDNIFDDSDKLSIVVGFGYENSAKWSSIIKTDNNYARKCMYTI